ncbi:hypothetical protein CVT26_012280 [Gymnopilus dilepis]|uniref:Uncharacterized protein n=1 Tax=Gymnopilus dilepis TaxID=231916 RepID=A0A409YQA6_9AGAR|nr:hypothetical protein CVT26_012280 [Gymnopilus dilepis]
MYQGSFAILLWLVSSALTPLNSKSKLSMDASKMPNVLKGCKLMTALEAMLIADLCLVALFLIALVFEIAMPESPQPRQRRMYNNASTAPRNNLIIEDGATDSARSQVDEAADRGVGQLSDPSNKPAPSQKGPASLSEGRDIDISTMDGAD